MIFLNPQPSHREIRRPSTGYPKPSWGEGVMHRSVGMAVGGACDTSLTVRKGLVSEENRPAEGWGGVEQACKSV